MSVKVEGLSHRISGQERKQNRSGIDFTNLRENIGHSVSEDQSDLIPA